MGSLCLPMVTNFTDPDYIRTTKYQNVAATFTLGRYSQSAEILNILDVTISMRKDFLCAECGKAIVCVLDVPEQSKHFRHKKELSKCRPALETLLHRTAKEIICAHNLMQLPERQPFAYSGQPEFGIGRYRADVALFGDNKKLLVEIVVSHPMSEQKNLDYQHLGADCLVIDLSDYPRTFHVADLKRELIDETGRKEYYGCLNLYFKAAQVEKASISKDGNTILGKIIGAVALAVTAYGLSKWLSNQPIFRRSGKR